MPVAVFLRYDQVIRIHAAMIERYGGHAGVRDPGLLASAIAMPQSAFGGQPLHSDIFEMAAAYLFHIVSNHPFFDGNKRAGAASAVVFLAINGIAIRADEEGLVEITMAVARSEATKAQIASFLRGIAE